MVPLRRKTRRYVFVVKFGQEIRRRRKALGMTIEELAEKSGLTPNYLGTVEIGHRDPSLSTVLALAKGLSIAPAELFGGVGKLSPEAVEAARLFDGAAADAQDAVLRLLRALQRRRR
jgi:transcriptional regulator with XRE-family HTH domain